MPQELRDLDRVCRDCSQPFTLSRLELLFFVDRGLQVPRRCHRCRDARRAAGIVTPEPAREGR